MNDVTDEAREVPRFVRLDEFADGDDAAWIGTASGEGGDCEAPSLRKNDLKNSFNFNKETFNPRALI